jgi:hypothetical protein
VYVIFFVVRIFIYIACPAWNERLPALRRTTCHGAVPAWQGKLYPWILMLHQTWLALRHTKVAMENHPFIDDFPMNNYVFIIATFRI